jgi:hypothetical protein
MLTACRPQALNALNHDLIRGLGEVIFELKTLKDPLQSTFLTILPP